MWFSRTSARQEEVSVLGQGTLISKCKYLWMKQVYFHITHYYTSVFFLVLVLVFLQKSAESYTETANGSENTQTPTQERESGHLCFLTCLWAQMAHLVSADQRNTDRSIATHLHQEEGVRVERGIQMEAAHIMDIHPHTMFHSENRPKGKVKDRRKVLRTILVRNWAYMGQKILWCQLKGNSPWQREQE